MHHEVQVFDDAAAVAREGARYVAELARSSAAQSGSFRFAVSGGSTPWAMFASLVSEDLPWEQMVIYQVDERVAPEGDPDRNLSHLRAALGGVSADVRPMPVNEDDLSAAADRYAGSLPEQFDLVHLGLGPDGHTASLVPADPVLSVEDRLVAITAPYQGHQRMTLTYPALARARQLLWLVTGSDKAGPLQRLLDGDPTIPAGRVVADRSLVMADRLALPAPA